MTEITSVTLKRQRWQWDWQWTSRRVTVIFQTIDWLTEFFHMFLRWLESPCSICFSPAWVRLTQHRCARLGSICTASWYQPWPEAGPRTANISPTEKKVDVRFTLEHPRGHKLTSQKSFQRVRGLDMGPYMGYGTQHWENQFSWVVFWLIEQS